MSPLPAAYGHTHSLKTQSHTHTLGQTNTVALHTLLFYHGCVDNKAGPCPNMVNGAVERSGSPANQRRVRAPTFFRVTHNRDSIDARAGGACVLNINRQRQRRSRGAITRWKNAKNSRGLEVRTFLWLEMILHTCTAGRCVITWCARKHLDGGFLS